MHEPGGGGPSLMGTAWSLIVLMVAASLAIPMFVHALPLLLPIIGIVVVLSLVLSLAYRGFRRW